MDEMVGKSGSHQHTRRDYAATLTMQALEDAMGANGRRLQRLTPRLLREALQLPKSGGCLRRAELGLLLAYAISDAPDKGPWDSELTAQLDLVPLLRLADAGQLHDGYGRGTSPGIATLRTAPDAQTPALWLCHQTDNRGYPDLLNRLGPAYPLDTTDADFLAAARKLVSRDMACNVLVGRAHATLHESRRAARQLHACNTLQTSQF